MTAPALRVYEHFWLRYRRTWRTTAIASFVEPLLYLGAMGLGLGTYVDRQGGADILDGLQYLWFIAPGLLAATAFQVASVEASWPVLGAFRWDRTYVAMHTTPLAPRHIAAGHLAWMATRIALTIVTFSLAMAAFGTWRSPWAPLGVLTAILGGVAFAAPLAAHAARKQRDDGFVGVNRFLVIPMFLFSGTFYPVDQLPAAAQVLAQALPLYHAVELTRAFTLGRIDWPAAGGHLAYLVALLGVGVYSAARIYGRRLGQ